jgi:predicted ATPase/class 3 adenylate cyclase
MATSPSLRHPRVAVTVTKGGLTLGTIPNRGIVQIDRAAPRMEAEHQLGRPATLVAVGAPSGTVTFLFTDIEGSTRLWDTAPTAMRTALERHDAILRSAIDSHGGYVFSTAGDAFSAAFPRASDALAAAISAQMSLSNETWPDDAFLAVRMGLHTGEATERDGDYFGSTVNRAARIMATAHGGQVLCSEVTAGLLKDEAAMVDLGQHRLRDLSAPQRIFQVGDGVFPPPRSIDAFPGNLPLQMSSFVGREKQLQRTAAALADSRVVTLTGVGGVGKTRLALQVAAEVLPRFADGAWLCELAPLRDPAGVSDSLAALFDVVPRGGQTIVQALEEFLRGKELLLVLDNCEHLLAPVAVLVDSLERSCPRLVVLATSREGLGIDGERILVVPSLASPVADAALDVVAESDAVRLFVERGQAVKSDFTVTSENASSVAQLCRRLDGIPLAIELAAARLPAMNPAEIARRLDRRFEVLAGGRRGAVERHQTLRAAIDWSYELATEPQRRLLARLTAFAGGCTLEAIEAVCAGDPVAAEDVWELIAALVSQSLVVAEDQGLDTRYRLLETIRQYGEERLDEHGETAELRRRHAEYYTAFASSLGDLFLGPQQVEAGIRMAAEQENMLRAMNTAIDIENVDLAFRLLLGVPVMSVQSGFSFHVPAEATLALSGASDHPEYSLALANVAHRMASHGENEHAERLCEEALSAERRLKSHPDGLVESWVGSARVVLALNQGLWGEAALLQEQNAELNRAHGRLANTSASLYAAGHCHAMAGKPEIGLPYALEGLALARQVGMPYLITLGLAAVASAFADSDPERARALLRECREVSEATHYESANQITVVLLTAARLRDKCLTLELAPRAIRLLHWNGDRPQLGGVLNIIAWATADKEPIAAAMLQGAARRLMLGDNAFRRDEDSTTSKGKAPTSVIGDLRRETTRRLEQALGADGLRDGRGDGGVLDVDQAVAVALELVDRVGRLSQGGSGPHFREQPL